MEVKMFVHNNLETIEKEINNWLSVNSIQICHITQSQSEKQGKFVFVISIFYEKNPALSIAMNEEAATMVKATA